MTIQSEKYKFSNAYLGNPIETKFRRELVRRVTLLGVEQYIRCKEQDIDTDDPPLIPSYDYKSVEQLLDLQISISHLVRTLKHTEALQEVNRAFEDLKASNIPNDRPLICVITGKDVGYSCMLRLKNLGYSFYASLHAVMRFIGEDFYIIRGKPFLEKWLATEREDYQEKVEMDIDYEETLKDRLEHREELKELVKQGHTDDEIKHALIIRGKLSQQRIYSLMGDVHILRNIQSIRKKHPKKRKIKKVM